MELEVKERVTLPPGRHAGVIIDVEYRDTPYQYTDLVIETVHKGKKQTLKAGYPTNLSTHSKLGKLLYRFGAVLDVGAKLDPNKVLVGKECQFQSMSEETKNGTFARVISDSVRPK